MSFMYKRNINNNFKQLEIFKIKQQTKRKLIENIYNNNNNLK